MNTVHDALVRSGIIPTVIDDFIPIFELKVAWKYYHANLGNTLRPRYLQTAPSVHIQKAGDKTLSDIMTDSSMTYVIVMTDPDAPSRQDPKWSEFCHWIRASYPALDEITGRRRRDLVEYKPPAPPTGTGPHRYVFLAFIPANGTRKRLHLTTPSGRIRWGSDTERTGVRDWANMNGLVPFAANFIYAEKKKQ
ncbi:hypothetical protein CEP51_002730 [Fusarium floridanum]|uniref:Carboxypeptidase Y inhibitor n=1 Tax=Fusarium floridanum TaxID=1325733 RepID=A0A428S9M7_9HYPO|nr:hypothetical protein CEP51_002730 [Fusarium floridanum]